MIITIERSQSFTPTFLGNDWVVEWQDERSLALSEIDLSRVCLEAHVMPGEEEADYKQLLNNKISLDAQALQAIWERIRGKRYSNCLPASWSERTTDGYTKFIGFYGTILRHLYNNRLAVLTLHWNSNMYNDLWGGPKFKREFCYLRPGCQQIVPVIK